MSTDKTGIEYLRQMLGPHRQVKAESPYLRAASLLYIAQAPINEDGEFTRLNDQGWADVWAMYIPARIAEVPAPWPVRALYDRHPKEWGRSMAVKVLLALADGERWNTCHTVTPTMHWDPSTPVSTGRGGYTDSPEVACGATVPDRMLTRDSCGVTCPECLTRAAHLHARRAEITSRRAEYIVMEQTRELPWSKL